MDKLFVYGIFLDENNRNRYGMSDPRYTTVKDYITLGNSIVEAVPVNPDVGAALTGLLVDIDVRFWKELDALEHGYDRILIKTTTGHQAYMYAAQSSAIKG